MFCVSLFFTGNTVYHLWWGFFAYKVNNKKLLTTFAKKLDHRLSIEFQIQLMAILSKKALILKIFPKLCETFCLYSYRADLVLLLQSEKCLTERNKRRLSL